MYLASQGCCFIQNIRSVLGLWEEIFWGDREKKLPLRGPTTPPASKGFPPGTIPLFAKADRQKPVHARNIV